MPGTKKGRLAHRIALLAGLLLAPGVGHAASFDLATASCASPEVEKFMMDTLPSFYSRVDGTSFAAGHTVERIIFASNARQSAQRLSCRLTVRLHFKGTTLPSQGFFVMDRMPNGRLRSFWMGQ